MPSGHTPARYTFSREQRRFQGVQGNESRGHRRERHRNCEQIRHLKSRTTSGDILNCCSVTNTTLVTTTTRRRAFLVEYNARFDSATGWIQ
jgi:hypothetical protein